MKFEGFFHKEAKDESLEASVNTGRMAEGITEDISKGQEQVESGEMRYAKILEGVATIMDEAEIPAEDAMGREDFFMEKLQEMGAITANDMSFASTLDAVKQAVRTVARKRLDKKGDDLQNRKIA